MECAYGYRKRMERAFEVVRRKLVHVYLRKHEPNVIAPQRAETSGMKPIPDLMFQQAA